MKIHVCWRAILLVSILINSTFISTNAQKADKNIIQKVMNEAYEKFKNDSRGKNADYIPYLAKVDSNLYGIAIVTPDGKVYELGDSKFEFGIESISKVFVLCLALESNTPEEIAQKVGVNATGFPFNSVTSIELQGKRAVNPLVNAGAMATNSLVKVQNGNSKWKTINDYFNRLAAREIKVIDELYHSEAETNQHNQAIAILLQSYNTIYDDPIMTCDLYTRQCSFGTSAKDLAIMAATLANNGVNPVTKDKIINPQNVTKTLAVMTTSGLYEDSGQWLYDIGLPAKSGVGGGIIAVAPGKMGICVFSPRVDQAGNSVKAIETIKYIAEKLQLNIFNPMK
ncbi:glutaminase [Solitalea longa]|uniref:Glutaminase n=1 Tax=Solitalea longa TaxID=2079460 RepID=A0A2S5A185_9SPHI|nr:glutaminase A [Solitalea longa]POY35883.1 glutaminase [Solitalea longa]